MTAYGAQYEKLVKIANELLEGNQEWTRKFGYFFDDLEPWYKLGEQFQEVDDIEIIETEGYTSKPATWSPTIGQISVIIIGPADGPSFREYLYPIQRMLIRNEHWSGKVEIVGLYSDYNIQTSIKFINYNKWTQVSHFWIRQPKQNFTLKAFQNGQRWSDEKVYIGLLNQQGIIVQIGQPDPKQVIVQIEQLLTQGVEDNNENPQQQQLKQLNEKQEEIDRKIVPEKILGEQNEAAMLEQNIYFDKSEFKALKQTMRQEVIPFLKQLNFQQSIVRFLLVKSNKVSQNGKICIKRAKVEISYTIPKQEEAKLEIFINYLNLTIKAGSYFIKIAKVIDLNNQECQKLRLDVQQLCQDNGIDLIYHDRRKFRYGCNRGNQTIYSNAEKAIVAILKKTTEQKVQSIKQQLDMLCRELDYDYQSFFKQCIIEEIKKADKFKIGDIFTPILGYSKAGKDPEEICHKEGQILIIFYWNSKNKYSVEKLCEQNQLIKNNKDQWGDQVRLAALCYRDVNSCKQCSVEISGLTEIELYFPPHKDMNDKHDFGVKEMNLNQSIIIDKNGRIHNINNDDEVQQVIQQLLKRKDLKDVTLDQCNQLRQFLNQQHDYFTQVNGKFDQFSFTLKIQELYSTEGEFIKIEQLTLDYWVKSNKLEQLQIKLKEIFNIIPQEYFWVTESVNPTFDIPFPGKECILCQSVLTDQIPQYYSPFQNVFVCVACAEFQDGTQKGITRYKYTGKLIYINAPLQDLSVLRGIEVEIIGYTEDELKKLNQITKIMVEEDSDQYLDEEQEPVQKQEQVQVEQNQENNQSFQCSSCLEVNYLPKYVCVNTVPRRKENGVWYYSHYCQKCFTILKQRDSEAAIVIIQKDAVVGMCTDGLLLRVLEQFGEQKRY